MRDESRRIVFHKVEAENFKSIGDLFVFDFEKHSGLNFVSGINHDIPGTRNGVGKCLVGETEIEIEFDDKNIEELFISFINSNGGGKSRLHYKKKRNENGNKTKIHKSIL